MPRTILQIDDEPGISKALLVRLQAAGYALISAADGPSGLDTAIAQRPDLILLDIRMPGMDGFEVCRHLKSSPHVADIPVIFLTANASDEARQAAVELGAAGFLAKPYEAGVVLDAIERALKAREGAESDER